MKAIRGLTVSIAIGVGQLMLPSTANAYTECSLTPQRFFIGQGILWVNYVEGGTGTLYQSSELFRETLAVIMAAIAMEKPVVVRYAATGVACSSQQEIAGVWLSR